MRKKSEVNRPNEAAKAILILNTHCSFQVNPFGFVFSWGKIFIVSQDINPFNLLL